MTGASGLVVPTEWERVVERLLSFTTNGLTRVMVVGGVDSGKTTMCKFLLGRACAAGLKAALVDADVGQSTLGPPTTIGAKIFMEEEDVFQDDVRPPFLRFVGGNSPAGRILACVVAARKALDWTCAQGPGLVVVDTTGLIDGDAGKELKARKADLLDPHFIVGIARDAELNPILTPLEKMARAVLRLPRCDAALVRSPAARQQFRLQKFQEYFKHSRLHEFPMDNLVIAECPSNLVTVFAPEQILTTQAPLDRDRLVGLLVGLEDESGRCLAVGLIEDMDTENRRLIIRRPSPGATGVKCVRIGRIGIE